MEVTIATTHLSIMCIQGSFKEGFHLLMESNSARKPSSDLLAAKPLQPLLKLE